MGEIKFYLWLIDFAPTIGILFVILGVIYTFLAVSALFGWPSSNDGADTAKRDIKRTLMLIGLAVVFVGASAALPKRKTIYMCAGLALSTFPKEKITDKELYDKISELIMKNLEDSSKK